MITEQMQTLDSFRIPALHMAECGKVVTKFVRPAQSALHQAAYTLSVESNLFCVPPILAKDESLGTINIAFIPGLVSLKDYLADTGCGTEMLVCVGRSLGLLHRKLHVIPDYVVEAPIPWRGQPDEQTLIHGDFNAINLCVDSVSGRLVILDWQSSPALPFWCTSATRYLDIAQFIRSLLLQQHSLLAGSRFFSKRVLSFREGYEQAAGIKLDKNKLAFYIEAYSRLAERKQWSAKKYLSWTQSRIGLVLTKLIL
jgi:tRNA A-37 threonylcarbamoyl transferase component Bud32